MDAFKYGIQMVHPRLSESLQEIGEGLKKRQRRKEGVIYKNRKGEETSVFFELSDLTLWHCPISQLFHLGICRRIHFFSLNSQL